MTIDREGDRERETEGVRERESERQKESEKVIDRKREREIDRHREREEEERAKTETERDRWFLIHFFIPFHDFCLVKTYGCHPYFISFLLSCILVDLLIQLIHVESFSPSTIIQSNHHLQP